MPTPPALLAALAALDPATADQATVGATTLALLEWRLGVVEVDAAAVPDERGWLHWRGSGLRRWHKRALDTLSPAAARTGLPDAVRRRLLAEGVHVTPEIELLAVAPETTAHEIAALLGRLRIAPLAVTGSETLAALLLAHPTLGAPERARLLRRATARRSRDDTGALVSAIVEVSVEHPGGSDLLMALTTLTPERWRGQLFAVVHHPRGTPGFWRALAAEADHSVDLVLAEHAPAVMDPEVWAMLAARPAAAARLLSHPRTPGWPALLRAALAEGSPAIGRAIVALTAPDATPPDPLDADLLAALLAHPATTRDQRLALARRYVARSPARSR